MYVCVCRGITDKQIVAAVDAGAQSLRDVRRTLGVSTVCGKCGPYAREVVRERVCNQAVEAVCEASPALAVPALTA